MLQHERYEGYYEESNACQPNAACQKPNNQSNNTCWQNEQNNLRNHYDYHDSNDYQQKQYQKVANISESRQLKAK